MFRFILGLGLLLQTSTASEVRGVQAVPCDESRAEQQFNYDDVTGHVSTLLDGVKYCAVVQGCGLGQDAPVILVPCASTNSTCASWKLVPPAHVATGSPDAKWIVAPGSTTSQPHCLETPHGETIDIYCCSGTGDCSARYPKPITHQQWMVPKGTGTLRLVSGPCMQASPTPLKSVPVWPIPSHMICSGSGTRHMFSSDVVVSVGGQGESSVATMAAQRYQALLREAGASDGVVKQISVEVSSSSEVLGLETDYSYTLSKKDGATSISAVAASPYAAVYALETLLQLQEQTCDSFDIEDSPVFRHRGLMIDTGRRFYPVPLVESLLEGMVMFKMNVLHFHLSEECFRVESKVHPSLHKTGCTVGGRSNNEYYTQEEIGKIVQYGKLRGIRVIPEFDMPGHSGGFCTTLKGEGIKCCGSQIEDDTDGKSVALINSVLEEMSELFPDTVMHIGCDETGSAAPCTLDNTKSFEEKVIKFLGTKGKTVMGWEEILFKTGAAEGRQDVIVDAWARASWQQAAAKGHPTVDSENGAFYLDSAGHTAAGMWRDIYKGETNVTMRGLLLGGEASMWQDQYVPSRSASCMFQSPERDVDFSNSTSSTIWPRSAIAAGSFWRYDPRLSTADPLFASVLDTAADRLAKRGVAACSCTHPTSTGCQQTEFCGKKWCSFEDLGDYTLV